MTRHEVRGRRSESKRAGAAQPATQRMGRLHHRAKAVRAVLANSGVLECWSVGVRTGPKHPTFNIESGKCSMKGACECLWLPWVAEALRVGTTRAPRAKLPNEPI